ncbi:formate dehydrogenase accessory sulfurtransferase FdhD [Sulfidibacter corallicola]|uniref:Sulfur carrier protein FdhD n=1 Tax=Sulfidibacter corallicola TaxID=2818388 RepID=A0A8A4TY98_SULCO|nr:formate dehydrogenase accessory sulfurtransferase FdhD [Sulfidibacter corallicola]QTD51505.1 formate dehydrogenase accessory sulfurtransferase FdhD [Sulfidibacter corallicola]
MMDRGLVRVDVKRFAGRAWREEPDQIAVEEPLEIRVVTTDQAISQSHPISVTMRTPGQDFDLALGFLFTEGVLQTPDCVRKVVYARDGDSEICNRVEVHLQPEVPFDPSHLSRHVFTSSSCGVCGKISIESVYQQLPPRTEPPPHFEVRTELLSSLPHRLSAAQISFARTGGVHACALFDSEGRLELVREDVSRHNALDKLIGGLWRTGRLPAEHRILLLSGRASFELIQKAAMSGLDFVAAIGAPSDLAIRLADEMGITLVGFLKADRFNVYCDSGRIAP